MNYQQDPILNDVVIWRYMDLAKFLDILVNKHLVFPRLDQFEDVYEGYPLKIKEAMAYAFTQTKEQDVRDNTSKAADIFFKLSKVRAYISCWHLNNVESAAMWKLYCKTNESIVIKTTVRKLKNSLIFKNTEYVDSLEFDNVDYSDDKSQLEAQYFDLASRKETIKVPYNQIFFSKRPSFQHEQEFRVLAFNSKKLIEPMHKDLSVDELKRTTPPIQKIECNVEELIEEIIIAPDAPQWFVELVRSLVSKLGYFFPISQSDLYTLK